MNKKVIDKLEKLREKMLSDRIGWASMYKDSGVIKYLESCNDEAFTLDEILAGDVDIRDIEYQIDYLKKEYEKEYEKH